MTELTTLHARDLTGEAFHHTAMDVVELQIIAAGLPPAPVIVNIGAAFGTSTLAMAEARPDAVIFSIDVNPCPAERHHHEQAGIDAGQVIRILGRSQDVARFWPWEVDFVFVDGSHAFDAVVEDALLWSDLVKPGGIIAFHDYGKPICPHVRPAVQKAMGTRVPDRIVDSIIVYTVNR